MILLVDDKQENLFSLKSLLQLNKYEVDTASSGEEALLKVLKRDYVLIILDVQMPGMDGYEVAENLNGYSKTRDIPIIFLSAVNIDKRFIMKGYDSGGIDYITKPFDADLLLLKVKTFCRLHDQKRELKQIQETLQNEVETRKKAQEAVEQMNQHLEELVEDRTRELVQLNHDLENSNAELAQYASLASHDLQEPLRKIITFTRLLDETDSALTPEAGKYMEKIVASSQRMRSLINDLLTYSKLSGSSYFTSVDLSQLLEEAFHDLELVIQEKQASIQLEPLPTIEAIPGQMRQMFQNIISNALKFSKSDSTPRIVIKSEYCQEKSIEAHSVQAGPFIRITISDNGIGFEEKYNEKIFTIFQRLHGFNAYEGTGIGLAIVKKIVEKHNGLISATSEPEQGTTFIIILPVNQSC